MKCRLESIRSKLLDTLDANAVTGLSGAKANIDLLFFEFPLAVLPHRVHGDARVLERLQVHLD